MLQFLQTTLKLLLHLSQKASPYYIYLKLYPLFSNVYPSGAFLRYAFGLISEYISDELSSALERHLDLPAVPKSVTNDEVKEPPSKRQKLGETKHEPTEDYSKELLPAKVCTLSY